MFIGFIKSFWLYYHKKHRLIVKQQDNGIFYNEIHSAQKRFQCTQQISFPFFYKFWNVKYNDDVFPECCYV